MWPPRDTRRPSRVPQLFAGKFAYCLEAPALPNATACAAAGLRWANPPFGHFDNIFSASLLLFEMSTLEGWTDVLWSGMDVTAAGQAPSRESSAPLALYFVVWVAFGALFLPNLFVGVLVDTYSHMKAKEDGYGFMTKEQRQWMKAMRVLLRSSPVRRAPRPAARLRGWLHDRVHSVRFDGVMLAAILANSALIAADGYGISPQQATTRDHGPRPPRGRHVAPA